MRVRPGVLGAEVAEADQVGDDLDLAAAAGAGADADRRDPQALGDGRRELLRDELEDHREGAGLLDRERVGDERARLVEGLALDADLADRVDRLRRQADVAHHRDAGTDERLDDPRRPDAALDLDRLGAGLAQEASRRCSIASSGVEYDRNGMSATTIARALPRTTAFVWWTISAIVTRTVVS